MDIMMNTVTSLQTTCSRENIVRLFARFANKYGTLWTNRLGANPDWEMCIDDWFEDLKHFDYKTLVLAAKSALATFSDFPPTFGQFEDLCKKHSGFLQCEDAIKMLIARDFSHPIVKMMYDKIGSWTLTNGKETEVQAKSKEAYKDAETQFTLFPDKCWAELEAYHAKPKELPPPENNKTATPHISVMERIAEYQKKLAEMKMKGETYKHFDEAKINKSNKNFDPQVYKEYRDYLLSIPEEQTLILPPKYLYERNRLLNAREQPEILRKAGYDPNPKPQEEVAPKRKYGASRPFYKNWSD